MQQPCVNAFRNLCLIMHVLLPLAQVDLCLALSQPTPW